MEQKLESDLKGGNSSPYVLVDMGLFPILPNLGAASLAALALDLLP